MKTLAWKDLKHKASPEERERIKREAIDEFDRMGFASLRKARQQTQAVLARRAAAPFTALSEMGRLVGLGLPGDAERVYTMPSGRFAVKIEDRATGLAYRSRILLSPADDGRPFWIAEPAISRLPVAEGATAALTAPRFPEP